ncbi:hypothetical protein TrRE_jg13199 [Triparma retinervis]|uniref:Uncharacterized protein n=1 Tax=Triparma retinervis TaxID=2557542 RepID=A0A9W7DUC9_9STRA|nr:hypothetical protein TrRE_jg13199 [Triparma retinervis]
MKLVIPFLIFAVSGTSGFNVVPITKRYDSKLMGVSKRARKKANLELQTAGAPPKRPGDEDREKLTSGLPTSPPPASPNSAQATQEVLVDEETGLRMISEGRAVMDVLTKQPVKLSDRGDEYRMAEFSPGVAPEVRDKHRIPRSSLTVDAMVSGLSDVLPSPVEDPCNDAALDFVVANRDWMGMEMKRCLTGMKLKAQSEGKMEEAKRLKELRDAYLILENKISAPFRQMVLNAEVSIGPNFANLDIRSYAGTAPYEVCATWVVLQGMRSVWEKKARDSSYYDNTVRSPKNTMEYLTKGDPNRFNADSERKFYGYDETAKMTAWAQKMAGAFGEDEELLKVITPEMRFVDRGMLISGGTELRKAAYEFAEEEGITVEGLREGVRRLVRQLENMQPDPYGKFTRIVNDLSRALEVGTEEEESVYKEHLYSVRKEGPGWFQTYKMKENDFSMLRFLDNEVDVKEGGLGPMDEVLKQLGFGGVVDKLGGKKDARPEELGWIENMDDPEAKGLYERRMEEQEREVVVEFEEEGEEAVMVPQDVVD